MYSFELIPILLQGLCKCLDLFVLHTRQEIELLEELVEFIAAAEAVLFGQLSHGTSASDRPCGFLLPEDFGIDLAQNDMDFIQAIELLQAAVQTEQNEDGKESKEQYRPEKMIQSKFHKCPLRLS